MIAINVPPATETLAVIVVVYGAVQGLKKIPTFTPYLTGWIAVGVNLVLTIGGLLVTIPANQLYTLNTLELLVATVLGSAGLHGTVKSMSQPQVLATIPPSTQVQEVPATLIPDNPAAIPAKTPVEGAQ